MALHKGLGSSAAPLSSVAAQPGHLFPQSVENCVCIMRNLSYHVHKEVPGADRYQEVEPGIPGSAATSQRRRKDDASCFGGKKAKGGWVRLRCVSFPPLPGLRALYVRGSGPGVLKSVPVGIQQVGKVQTQGLALALSCGPWMLVTSVCSGEGFRGPTNDTT